MKREPANTRITKTCPICAEEFEVPRSHSLRRKCCSVKCYSVHLRRRAAATYPSAEEVRRLYEDEGLTDRELGRKFGHTHTWALKVRQHYKIEGRRKGSWKRKPRHRKNDRGRWAISLKPSERCRNCQQPADVLHLHHAVPRSLSPAGKFDLRNGIQLCAHCHLGWHNRHVQITRDVFTSEEWAFIETLIGPVWLEERYPEPDTVAA